MSPLFYSSHISPSTRVGAVLAQDKRSGLAFQLLSHFPQCQVSLLGEGVAQAVQGKQPEQLRFGVSGLTPERLDKYLLAQGQTQTIEFIALGANNHRQDVFDYCHAQPFSLDAIIYSVNRHQIVDPFGGLADLAQQRLRPVGKFDQLINTNPALNLRGLKLAGQYGLSPSVKIRDSWDDSWEALQAVSAGADGFGEYRYPRRMVGEGFAQVLATGKEGMNWWQDSLASKTLTPELGLLEQTHSAKHEHGLAEGLESLIKLPVQMAELALSALLLPLENLAVPTLKKLIAKLHLFHSRSINHSKAEWLTHHGYHLLHLPAHLGEPSYGQLAQHEHSVDLGRLLKAQHQVMSFDHKRLERLERLHEAITRYDSVASDMKQERLIKGRDLMSVGFLPGSHVRFILQKVFDAQRCGLISSKEEAIRLALGMI